MAGERLTELRIKGLRTIEDLRLPLEGLTVLIGPNGCGKSSVLEACTLLHRVTLQSFAEDFHSVHGGLKALLRQGSTVLGLGVSGHGDRGPFAYDIEVEQWGSLTAGIRHEQLTAGGKNVFRRNPSGIEVTNIAAIPEVPKAQPLLGAFGAAGRNTVVEDARRLIGSFQVHLAFDVRPYWASREIGVTPPTRDSVVVQETPFLTRFGTNLPNAYLALQNRDDWDETLDWIRLGLGNMVEKINLRADPGGGRIALAVKMRNLPEPLPAFVLSDGMLSYLALVAALRLGTNGTLLAIDEPEAHLHPELVVRVTQLLEQCSAKVPVLVATHSDALLDALQEPARSTRVCELDEQSRMRVDRLEPEALGRWLQRYRGVGEIRAAGYLGQTQLGQ